MATTYTGTYDINTLLATRLSSAAAFGLSTIQDVLQADLAAHNAIVADMLRDLAEFSSDRQRTYGAGVTGEMVEVDEYGRSPSQRGTTGSTVGFPLRLFQFAIGWTEKYFEIATPADMAQMQINAQKAHIRAISRELRRALFLSANYTWNDFLVDKVDLAVKRLVNADSASIPSGPNGETYNGSSHTHYEAVTTLSATNFKAHIRNVVEHGHGNRVITAINAGDEATVAALTGFKYYQDPRMVYRASDTPARTLDLSRLDNRAIGTFDAAEVWVKSWMPSGYAFTWDAGDTDKPLVFRQRSAERLQGLRIAATNSAFPLVAQYYEDEYGIGVWTRTNGGVLEFGVDTTYTDPSIS